MIIKSIKQQSVLGCCAALTVCIGMTLTYALWQWHSDWSLTHQPITTSTPVATDTTAQLIAEIPQAHLFGQSITRMGEVPITNLQLEVTGIVKINNEQNNESSKAYISIAGKPSKIYQNGDSLPDGVKIYAITTDTVILENGGRLEKLPLPREKLEFKPIQHEEF